MNAATPNPSALSCGLTRRRAFVAAGGGLVAALLLGGCHSTPPARPVAARPRPEPARKPEPKGPEYDGYLK